ncbi:MAG: immunoglobulin domain-containing protein, partial [Planctomycetaceae bacterium]|nr:immunoglobulin domain-containing protein [Planctomycetaceae bacterium]
TGATWPVQQIIRASDFNSNDHFGASVSVLGNRLVVGAPEDNNAEGVDAGSAYVYTRSSGVWGGQFRISPSQLEAGDQFGVSVGIVSSNRIVVGAYGDNTGALNNSGAAYIFDSQLQVFPNPPIWVVSEVLIPTDVASGDNFGYSLAVSGNVVVVGSLLDDNGGGVDAGSAYVFTYTEFPPALRGWDAGVKLLSGGNDPDDQFGFSVAIEGEVIVVGVPNDDNAGGPNAGTAVVYKKFPGAGWSEQVRFAAPDAAAGDYFGVSVAISGGNLVAGSFGDDNATGVDAGSVYAFDLTVNPPVFLGPPASVAACPGGQASFTAAYVESGLRLYSWRRNGVQLSNQSGHIAGAQSETLIITGVTAADAGEYTCVVTNACGATTSAAAQLTLNAADFNCTGGTTIQDIFDFLAAYFGNNPSADFNGSGGVTVQDIFDFLSAYFGG